MREVRDSLGLLGLDHVELWVADDEATARRLECAFGMRPIAHAITASSVQRVLGQAEVRFVVTASREAGSEIDRHVRRFGDSIRDLAFRVEDAERAYHLALTRGARAVREPTRTSDADGELRRATIGALGNIVHSLVERGAYAGPHAPGFVPSTPSALSPGPEPGLLEIDHVNTALPTGATDAWLAFYRDVFGFTELQRFDASQLSTRESALSSRVLRAPRGRFLMPSAEPVPGRPGHIDRGIAAHEGPYLQHVAIRCDDLERSVRSLRARGARFMRVPDAYYRALPRRIGLTAGELAALAELQILVDEDDEGRLLQIFTEHIGNEVWLEYVERRGSRSNLGERNIQALALAAELHEASSSTPS